MNKYLQINKPKERLSIPESSHDKRVPQGIRIGASRVHEPRQIFIDVLWSKCMFIIIRKFSCPELELKKGVYFRYILLFKVRSSQLNF